MQFKHPEILWALLLLLIPILIHLFQLRRFKSTPFTNVAMLQKVVAESRKSNRLKKWLLLLTRLLLLAALVIAFAQPFKAASTALQEKETVVYLDNSFSMQAKANGLTLLEKSVQDFIAHVDDDQVFSLFTNTETFKNVVIKDIQNKLLSLPYTHKQLQFDAIELKANSLFSDSESSLKNLVLISDFQETIGDLDPEEALPFQSKYVSIRPAETRNIALDSVWIQNHNADQAKLNLELSGGEDGENIPVSVHNGETLIAKTSVSMESNGSGSVELTIPAKEEIQGRISVSDNSLDYDNRFYFNINKRERVKILVVGSTESDYLSRLYTSDEFDLSVYDLNQLDYSALDNQNAVVLNQLPSLPNGLQKVLRTFRENGGTLIVVPSKTSDLDTYNQFLSGFSATKLLNSPTAPKKITGIRFDHPLYRNVFEKRVTNFQYPTVNSYYQLQTNAPSILLMEGGEPLLSGLNGFYLFTAPLDLENTNFKNSPLIVPTFYNMAAFSLKAPKTYHPLGQHNTIDLSLDLGNDDILNVSKPGLEFIPLQQSFTNRVRLTFDENPTEDGIFAIKKSDEIVRHISFNYPRNESKLDYLPLDGLNQNSLHDSVSGLFDSLEADNAITAYWKWFVILALILALLEVLIQKFVT